MVDQDKPTYTGHRFVADDVATRQQPCPHCGAPMIASTPAAPEHIGPRFAPQRIDVRYSDEQAGYIAACGGASGFGRTPEDALREFRTAYHRLPDTEQSCAAAPPPKTWRDRPSQA